MTLTLKQKEQFLRNRGRARMVILAQVRKEKGIVFGARAVNRQVPKHLRSQTQDYDVVVKGDPKKSAKRIERRLDKKFGGNFYKVKPAQHSGTFKIVSNVDKKGVVDVSQQKEKIGTVRTLSLVFILSNTIYIFTSLKFLYHLKSLALNNLKSLDILLGLFLRFFFLASANLILSLENLSLSCRNLL